MHEPVDIKPARVLAICMENKFRSNLELSQDIEKFKFSFGQLGFSVDTDRNLITAGILRGFCTKLEYIGSELYYSEENYKWHEDFVKAVLSDYATHYKAKRADYVSKNLTVKDLDNMPEYYSNIKSPDKKAFKLVFGLELDEFFLSEKDTF